MFKKLIKASLIIFLTLMLFNFGFVNQKGYATIDNYGTVTLLGGYQANNFSKIYDLTKYDMLIMFTYDATGLVDTSGCHAWAEIGIRAVGYGNFNPTWQSEGAGIWIATDYDWTPGTFNPDPPGNPVLDIDDKIILQKGGGWDESKYNLPSSPTTPSINYGIWFDRDGVDQWQATYWGSVNGGTYNTNGRYKIELKIHATSNTTGTAYLKINGVSQGFYNGSWKNAQPDIYPAGMTFTGNMTQMQVFYGLYGYGATHTVKFENIKIILNDEVWVDDDWAGSSPGQEVAPGKIFGFNAFATIQDGVNGVASGGKVWVADGTYNEQVNVNKTVALIGSGSTNTTTLIGSGTGNGILINAPNVYINGFEITNYAIGIRSYGGPSNLGDLKIINCYLHHNTQNGILLVYDTFNIIYIVNNIISNNNQNGIGLVDSINISLLHIKDININNNGHHGLFIAQANIQNIKIENSNFDNSTTNGFSGITFGTKASNIGNFEMTGGSLKNNKGCGLSIVQKAHIFQSIIIDGVTITGNTESGIMLGGGASTNNLTIKNSLFQNNGWEHVDLCGGWFGAFSVNNDLLMENNFFKSGPWCGIYIGSLGSFNTTDIHYNYFIGSGFGIYNLNIKAFNATHNWWGDESGPSGNGPGTGAQITSNVLYSPWLVPNISVTKTDSPDPVAQGMLLTYTINWTMGATWATWDGTTVGTTTVNIPTGLTFGNVILKDTLPSQVTFVSCTGGGTYASGVVTWNLGTYIPGTNGTVSINTNVNLGILDGIITNNVEISYDTLKIIDDEITSVEQGAGCTYIFYDPRNDAYIMFSPCVPRWRVVIPSKGYDTGWIPFRRYKRISNYFWGEYADIRYHYIMDFYSLNRYHIIFNDRAGNITIKIAE